MRDSFVDDGLRYVYCAIPKVSCSTWKTVLLRLTGKIQPNRTEDLSTFDVHDRSFKEQYLPTFDMYRPDEIRYRIDNYYKFLFVREPFKRLVSAYLDKFVRTSSYQKLVGVIIVKRYRQHPTEEALEKGNDVTFEEFVRLILDPEVRAMRTYDVHWRPYYESCHPCHIKYDFIGKFETLHEDAAYVLNRFYS